MRYFFLPNLAIIITILRQLPKLQGQQPKTHSQVSNRKSATRDYQTRFKADVTKWGTFWDSFESSADKAEEMSLID